MRGGTTLLLVLLTLICAIYPLGLPASLRTGSAFNPATEIVTVRPEARVAAPRVEKATPDPREPTLRMAARRTAPLAPRATSFAPTSWPTALPVARSPAQPFSARAPPLSA